MATTPSVTFDKIEAHLNNQQLQELQPGGALHFTAADAALAKKAQTSTAVAPVDVLGKVCGAYQMVKPIVSLIQGLWLVPKRWKDAIKAFQSLMDTLCPGA